MGRGQVCDFGGDGNTFREIFVDRSEADADREKTCDDVCGANSRVGAYANDPVNKCRRVQNGQEDCILRERLHLSLCLTLDDSVDTI